MLFESGILQSLIPYLLSARNYLLYIANFQFSSRTKNNVCTAAFIVSQAETAARCILRDIQLHQSGFIFSFPLWWLNFDILQFPNLAPALKVHDTGFFAFWLFLIGTSSLYSNEFKPMSIKCSLPNVTSCVKIVSFVWGWVIRMVQYFCFCNVCLFGRLRFPSILAFLFWQKKCIAFNISQIHPTFNVDELVYCVADQGKIETM